ncbi:MAG: cation transporter [Lentisphaerae bacterium]|nr:cation transporter [Lentisphaerota bacterium]
MKRHVGQADRWVHDHRFGAVDEHAERMARWVVIVTACMMAVEIAAGWLSGSMALLADGWHMGTHMLALGISVFAYRFARRHRDNPAFTFGTGKVGSLAAFTSAIILGIVALGMAGESVSRLITPVEVHFGQAFTVACIGLAVNLLCAGLLHSPGHGHGNHNHDHNLRAAFIHVVADALTSVLAMIALLGVRFWGLVWMDPAIGLLGAAMIAIWALGLLKETGRTLLDAGVEPGTLSRIRERLESDADNCVSDLHVWRLGGEDLGLAVCIVTHDPRPAAHYRELLSSFSQVRHSTIEVVRCEEKHTGSEDEGIGERR